MNMNRKRVCLTAGLLLCAAALAACDTLRLLKPGAPQDYAEIKVSGVVTSEATGAPIAGATVSLREQNLSGVFEKTTNAEGQYSHELGLGYSPSKGCHLILTVAANGFTTKATNPATDPPKCINTPQIVSMTLQPTP
jgi:predicted small secreted protein